MVLNYQPSRAARFKWNQRVDLKLKLRKDLNQCYKVYPFQTFSLRHAEVKYQKSRII